MKKRSISKNCVGSGILHKIFFVVVLGVLVYFAYLIFMNRREGFQSSMPASARPAMLAEKKQTPEEKCRSNCYITCKDNTQWSNCINSCTSRCKK